MTPVAHEHVLLSSLEAHASSRGDVVFVAGVADGSVRVDGVGGVGDAAAVYDVDVARVEGTLGERDEGVAAVAVLVGPRAAPVALDHGALALAAHRAGFLAHVLRMVELVGEDVFVVGGEEDGGDVARGGGVGAVVAHLAENLEHVEVIAGVLEGDETAALAARAIQAVHVEGDVRVGERRVQLRLEEVAADARGGAREGEEGVEERGLVVGVLVRGRLGRRTVARNRHRDGGGGEVEGTARGGGPRRRASANTKRDHAGFSRTRAA